MTEENVNYCNKIEICKTTRRILRYSLVWPIEEEELNPGLNYKIRVFGFFLIGSILCASLSIHLSIIILKYPKINIDENLATLIAAFGCLFMVFSFTKKQQNIANLLKDLSDFRKFGPPLNFQEQNEKLNFWVKMLFIYTLLAMFCYAILKFFEKSTCNLSFEQNGFKDNSCGLVSFFWIPFNIDRLVIFLVVDIYFIITSHLVIKMCLHISVNAFEIAHHIILRVKHLKFMISQCFDDLNYEINKEKLRICILYHTEILEFAARLNNAFFECMFGHFTLTGAICACLEKQIIDKENIIGAVVHIIGWLLALFLACFGGQNFLNASEIVPKAIWESNWYEADLRLQKDILMMLLRAQKNFVIRAGPFGILSFSLFLAVIKTSYSILCMLTS